MTMLIMMKTTLKAIVAVVLEWLKCDTGALVSWLCEITLDREVVRSNPGTDYYIDSLLTAICCKKASLIEKSKIKRREWRTILKKPNGWRTYNNLWLMLTSFNVCKKLGYRKHTFLSSRWPIAGCRLPPLPHPQLRKRDIWHGTMLQMFAQKMIFMTQIGTQWLIL